MLVYFIQFMKSDPIKKAPHPNDMEALFLLNGADDCMDAGGRATPGAVAED